MINKEIINNLVEELKKYLHQKTNYSFKSLREIFGNKLENDDDLFYLICRVMNEALDNFNFETPVFYNKYLFKCTGYLNDKKYEIENKKHFVKILNYIKQNINEMIKNNKSETSAAYSSKSFLLSLSSELNKCIYKLKGIEHEDNYNENEVYDLMRNLIFKVKNPLYIDQIFENYSNLATLKNNQRYLFDEIMERYLNILINSDDRYEILYFDKLVNTFINNSNSSEIKSIVFYKKDKLLNSLDERNIPDERKEQIRFFLKEIENSYKNKKSDKETIIDNLKIKYNIDRIKALDKFKLVNPYWKNYKGCYRYIVTFDDPGAKVYENAISIDLTEEGHILLNYYVSDVNAYLDEDEDLREYARKNSLSVKGSPMLPEDIRKRVSLIEGKKRKVITYKFRFEGNNLVGFKVDRELIKVKYNLKFSDVKKILDYPVDSKLKEKVSLLSAFSNCLPINENGNYNVKEISKNIMFDEQYTENNNGSKMINDYQLFLNAFISDYCNKKDLPYLFRNNESNRSIDVIEELKSKYAYNENIQDMLNLVYAIYEPSYYSTENRGHLGLNLDSYGEVSKPARSYASAINQALTIKYFIDNVELSELEKNRLRRELEKECEFINNKKTISDDYVSELNKVNKGKK